ncbi:uncharacterized protein EV422DRAFT_501993 [Fimicolochytrium jonesii]|uniref:uncharacterized protein n=1 Tax=Fimicolochytrium jonesii TaxID=1396493 RepID=UPI0022FF39C1|nr:uncharacterized protein EV422DRAFT_501993 [Fimicolochytrium jonesii]KAI8815798.1 hypothetical protein EV422DRAFT_501993 [Fimicolochytrium jonesii]
MVPPAATTLPPLRLLTGGTLTPVPDFTTEHDSDNDSVLQGHYLRFQRTLLTAVDARVQDLEAKLRENEHAVALTGEEKQAVGVELYKAKKEIGRLNDGLGKVQSILQYSENGRKVLETDREAAEREIARMMQANRHVSSSLEITRRQLDDSSTKLSQMNEVNAAYFSSIKVQRRVEEKLKKELELAEERRKAAEVETEEMKKKFEELAKSKKEVEETLTLQRSETTMAQGALHKMHKEIADLTTSNRVLSKQWEESISAMAKRDMTFQTVNDSKEKMVVEVADANSEIRALKKEKAEVERRLRDKELGLSDNLSTLRTSLSSSDTKGRDLRSELVEAQVAESLYKQQLDKLAVDELQRKSEMVSDLKSRLESVKQEFENKLRNDVLLNVAKREEQFESWATTEVEAVTRDEENKTTLLRREQAQLRLENNTLQETIRELRHQLTVANERYEHINGHYSRLYDESKHIIYSLEKKEHDVNALKGRLAENVRGKNASPCTPLLYSQLKSECFLARCGIRG